MIIVSLRDDFKRPHSPAGAKELTFEQLERTG